MLKPDRLCAFTDGVVAIAITLLVLGLEVPSVHKVPPQELQAYLIDSFHPFVGFISSFVLIGTYWLQHYAIFHFVTHANRVFVALNGLFLLCITFIPFPTGLLAAYRHDELATIFYACTNIACSLSLLSLWMYAAHRHRLIDSEVAPDVIRSITRRIAITPAISLAAIAMSFVNITAGRAIFLAIPIVYLSHRAADAGWMVANNSHIAPELSDPEENPRAPS